MKAITGEILLAGGGKKRRKRLRWDGDGDATGRGGAFSIKKGMWQGTQVLHGEDSGTLVGEGSTGWKVKALGGEGD